MATIETPRLTFRAMETADLDAVLQIENRSYAFPWTRGIFADCLAQGYECRVASVNSAVDAASALSQKLSIVGHGVLSVGAGEAHLLNVCVGREHQGQGFGRELVLHMVQRAHVRGAQNVYLEVRPSNRAALALYASIGFQQIGTRKDYYPSELGREDAWVLGLPLTVASS